MKIVNWKRSVNGKKLRRNDDLKPKSKFDNYKIIKYISIIGIIAEQVLTAYERPVQWEQSVILSYLIYFMSSRSQVVLSNLVII